MEMKEKELWMKKLKEKLDNYSEPMPASSWERLEKELASPAEKKIYPYPRWTVAAAAVLLAVVSSLSLYFLRTPAADEMRHIQTPSLAFSPDVLPGVQQPDPKGSVIEPVLRSVAKDRLAKAERITSDPETKEVKPIEKSGNESQPTQGENVQAQEKKENQLPNEVNTPKEVNPEEEMNVVSGKKTIEGQPKSKSRRPSGKDKLHIPVEKAPAKKETWSMGLSVGNSGGASSEIASSVSGYMSRISMSAVSNDFMQIPNDKTLVFEEGVPYLLQAKKVADIEHHQPISFGVNVRKKLARGFSLETGLTYTLLSSDAKLTDSKQMIEQKLHYLGIPLRANWNFIDKRLFTLYVSGGGMIEKCVYGKLGSEKEDVKPLQFSVSGAVGAQINATKRVGIYVEPGVAYFFDDGSDVQTIRKENPFNFNIQAGIRLTY